MAIARSSMSSRNAWTSTAIVVLLLPQLVGILGLLPRYAFSEGGAALRFFAVWFALVALATLAGLWLRKSWALWATLVIVSLMATTDLFAWARNLDRNLVAISAALLVIVAALVFRESIPPTRRVSAYQRVLFGCVFLFAAWVAIWGLLLPAYVNNALPFMVPPLHARFLGAMYLSGAVFLLLGIFARNWSEIRVMTLMLAVWTGMLGLISALHLAAFDWARAQVWFWFFAYICYPLIAFWIAWCQRGENAADGGPTISARLRVYLNAQGAVGFLLGLCLLVAPASMATIWPWRIPVLLAQIYSAPFLSYGIGSLYAARQRTWSEVRIVIVGTLVFTLGVLSASMLHAKLFNVHALATWLWFGTFGLASVALILLSSVPSLRTRAGTK